MKSKRILIVSASIGNGHMQAASTIREELKLATSCDVEVVDFLQIGQFRYPQFNRLQIEMMNLMKSSYYGILKAAPNVYKGIYKITENQKTRKVIDFINAANQKAMASLIRCYRPHVVVCTHPFPLGAASALRYKKELHYTLSGVVTDFSVHPWWIAGGVDHYFVANEMMVRHLLRYGICSSKITSSGIPVSREFKPDERRAVNKIPKLLVMGGGLGFGSMETTLHMLEELPQPIEVTIVTGKNKKLEQQLRSITTSLCNKVNIMSFSPHIAAMMKQTDLLITKPGGLTCSEALAVHLPMVLLNPLPGQEEGNAMYLHQQGSASWVQEKGDFVGTVNNLLFAKPEWLKEMKDKCAEISPRYAGMEIAKKLSFIARHGVNSTASDKEYWKEAGVR